MASSARRLQLVLAVAVALGLAAPVAASAATTRYASPTGTGASPCLQTAPCSIETALDNAGPEGLANGDTVLLAPGTYEPVAELDVFRVGVTITGGPGEPSPLIEVKGSRGLNVPNVATLRGLRIHAGSTLTTYALAVTRPGSVVERVEVTGVANVGCGFAAAAVRDTVCSATPAPNTGEGVSLSISGGTPETFETTLTNVTAIGGSAGIAAIANESSTIVVNATNTIAVGEIADIFADSVQPTAPVEVNLSHSNFAQIEKEGTESHVTSPSAAGNQTAAPLLVDEAGGDYREQATSPTRLAGDLGAVLPGELDLAGNPRSTNCEGTVGVDIGAFQYECPTPKTPETPLPEQQPPKDETKPGPQHPCTCALVLPRLTKLVLKPAKFTTTGKAPKGTTISYFLSEGATVKIEVLGTKTVKGKKKTVTLGSLPHAPGNAGANSVKFNGKVKGKPLEPGKYTLQVAAGGPGVSAKPATKTFTVLAATG